MTMVHPPLPSALDYLIVAPSANPFLLRWGMPTSEIRGGVPGSGYQMVSAPRSNVPTAGGHSMHPGDQTANPQPVGVWHHVSIEPRESLVPPGTTIADTINASAVESQGNRASMLKARMKIAMGNSRTREIEFDIGAGVDFDVRAFAVLGIDALVPDPAGPGGVPEDLAADPHGLVTILTTAVYCGGPPCGYKNPLTYSQALLMANETAIRAAVPVKPAAREVQLFVQGSADAANAEIVFAFVNSEMPLVASVDDFTLPFVELGAETIPAGETSTKIVLIPGGTNMLLVRSDAGQMQGTLVQVLNL